ncbi:MAG: NnrS family protein [Burkholderiaceae bacterium]
MDTDALPILQPGASVSPPPHGWPVFRLGFRAFYLAAASFGVLAVPLWIAVFLGAVPLDLVVSPLLWHAHEMLFGFATAVIIGFLLTAGKLWTGLATPRGPWLAALTALWLLGRATAFGSSYALYAWIDLALLLTVAVIFTRLIIKSRNWRNLPIAAVLLLLIVSNSLFHLAVSGIAELSPLKPLYGGLALIVLIECLMAGRVIPAFTKSVNRGLQLNTNALTEKLVFAVTAMALALWIFSGPALPTAIALALAGALHLARQAQWHPRATLKRPILWILHASYAWLAVGFGLLAASQMGWVAATAGIHSLAIGATGGLIIGMMTRTARGHTGRPIHASRTEVLAYGLIMATAVIRVFVPLVAPHTLPAALVLAAICWSTAFALYLVVFAPWLLSTRLDGKDG